MEVILTMLPSYNEHFSLAKQSMLETHEGVSAILHLLAMHLLQIYNSFTAFADEHERLMWVCYHKSTMN